MKNNLIIIVFASLLMFACTYHEKRNETIDLKIGNTSVIIDSDIEAINIATYLIEEYEIRDSTLPKTNYQIQVETKFNKYLDHPFIVFLRNKHKDGLGFGKPQVIYLLSKYDNIQNDRQKELLKIIGDIKEVEMFIALLRKFQIDTNYNRFFNEHKEFYNSQIRNLVEDLHGKDPISTDNYGTKMNMKMLEIYVSVLQYPTSGLCFELSRNDITTIMIACSSKQPDNYYFDGMVGILYHEVAHSYVTPKLFKYETEIDRKSIHIDKDLLEKMDKHAYGSLRGIINEYITRGITIVSLKKDSNNIAADESRENDLRQDFYFIDEIVKIIEDNWNKDIDMAIYEAVNYLYNKLLVESKVPNNRFKPIRLWHGCVLLATLVNAQTAPLRLTA